MHQGSPEIMLYLLRHTESQVQFQSDRIVGQSDKAPLTSTGHRQADRRGLFLLKHGIVPDIVYSTPAVRGREAITDTLRVMGRGYMKIHDVPELREMNQGPWEGELRSLTYTEDRIKDIARLGKDFKLPGAESQNELGRRVLSWMNRLTPLPDKEEPTVVFGSSHRFAITCAAGDETMENWSHAEILKRAKTLELGAMAVFGRYDGQWHMHEFGINAAGVR